MSERLTKKEMRELARSERENRLAQAQIDQSKRRFLITGGIAVASISTGLVFLSLPGITSNQEIKTTTQPTNPLPSLPDNIYKRKIEEFDVLANRNPSLINTLAPEINNLAIDCFSE